MTSTRVSDETSYESESAHHRLDPVLMVLLLPRDATLPPPPPPPLPLPPFSPAAFQGAPAYEVLAAVLDARAKAATPAGSGFSLAYSDAGLVGVSGTAKNAEAAALAHSLVGCLKVGHSRGHGAGSWPRWKSRCTVIG